MKLDPYLRPYAKINQKSQWKSYVFFKFLEKYLDINIYDASLGNSFLGKTSWKQRN